MGLLFCGWHIPQGFRASHSTTCLSPHQPYGLLVGTVNDNLFNLNNLWFNYWFLWCGTNCALKKVLSCQGVDVAHGFGVEHFHGSNGDGVAA